MSHDSVPAFPSFEAAAVDASNSSDRSASPQLPPRKKGRLQLDCDATSTMSIAQSFNLHDFLCNMRESNGSRYPDFIISKVIAAFEHQITQDSLLRLRGLAFSTKRLQRSACLAGNSNEACEWRLCFGAIPSQCSDKELAVQCKSAHGVIKSEYLKCVIEANKQCAQNLQDWLSELDENSCRHLRAEMLYIYAIKILFHNANPFHATSVNNAIVAELCSQASYEELAGLKGADDADTTACLSALATSLAKQNKVDQARHCYMKCIAASQAARGNSEITVRFQLDLANMLFKQGSVEEPAVMCVRILSEFDQNSECSSQAAAHICRLAEQAAKSKGTLHSVESDSADKASVLTKVFEHALSLNAASEMRFFRPFVSLLKKDCEANENQMDSVPALRFLLSFFEFSQMRLNATSYEHVLLRFKTLGLQDCHFYIIRGVWQQASPAIPPWNLLDFWNNTVRYVREVSASFPLPVDVDSLPVPMRLHAILYSSGLPQNINLSLIFHETRTMREAELLQLVRKMQEHSERITQLNLSRQISRHEIRSTLILDLMESLARMTALQRLDLSHTSYAHEVPSSFRIYCSKGHALQQVKHDKFVPSFTKSGSHFIYRIPKTCAVCKWNAHVYEETVMFHKRYHWQSSWRCNLCVHNCEVCFVCAHENFAKSSPLETAIHAALVRSLMNLSGLKTLNLSGSDFIKKADVMLKLTDSIAKLTALQHLNLSSVSLSPNVNASFGTMLLSLTRLKTLNLSATRCSGTHKSSFCHSVLPSIVQLRDLQCFYVDESVWDFIRGGFWLESGLVVPPFEVLPENKFLSSNDSSVNRAKSWIRVLQYVREVSASFPLPVDVDSLPVPMRLHAILYSSGLPPNIDITDCSLRGIGLYKLSEAELLHLLQKLHRHSEIVSHLSMNADDVSSAAFRSVMQEVWKRIADSACLQQLSLSGCWWCDSSFWNALPFLTNLHTLDLHHSIERNKKHDLGRCHTNLYQSLTSLFGLRRLDLGYASHKIAKKVDEVRGRGSTTLALNLYNDFEVPVSFFSSLKTLNLNNCQVSVPKMLSGMIDLQTLRIIRDVHGTVSFPSTNIAMHQSLAGLSALHSLELYSTFDEPSAAAFLQSCASLTALHSLTFSSLHFSNGAALADFCRSIAVLTMLHTLDLRLPRRFESAVFYSWGEMSARRGDACELGNLYESLKRMHTLKTLVIGFNELEKNYEKKFVQDPSETIWGIESFHQTLVFLTGLTSLKLPFVGVGNSITSSLAVLTQLQTLDLQSNKITGAAFPNMCRMLSLMTRVQNLNLSLNFNARCCSAVPSQERANFCRSLQLMTALRTLDLSDCFNDMDKTFYGALASSLFQLTLLESAKISQSVDECVRSGIWQCAGLSVPPYDRYHKNDWVKALKYCRQKASPFSLPLDLKALSNAERRHVILYSASIPTQINLKKLFNHELEQLVQQFRSHPQHVTHLSLDLGQLDRMDIIPQLAVVISDLTALQTLSLAHRTKQHNSSQHNENCAVLPASLTLTAMTSLEVLRIIGFNVLAEAGFDVARALAALPGLRILKIAKCCSCSKSSAALNPSIHNLTLLEHLNISRFFISAHGGFDIEQALTALPALRTLKISRCSCDEESFMALCASFHSLTLLEQFKLADISFSGRQIVHLASALTALTRLKVLDLSRICVNMHTCCVIARSCLHLPQLQSVTLYHDFTACLHNWKLVGLALPHSLQPACNRRYVQPAFNYNSSPTNYNWNYAIRHQLCFQLMRSSRHHLTRILSVGVRASFSCLLRHPATFDSTSSPATYRTQTQSQLLLLTCFGGLLAHVLKELMYKGIRQRKDPCTFLIERLFNSRMVQHLFRLSNYQETRSANKHVWTHNKHQPYD